MRVASSLKLYCHYYVIMTILCIFLPKLYPGVPTRVPAIASISHNVFEAVPQRKHITKVGQMICKPQIHAFDWSMVKLLNFKDPVFDLWSKQ